MVKLHWNGLLVAMLGVFAWATPTPADAFCGAYLGSAEAPLTNTTSTVVYVRQGNRNTITMANDIRGGMQSFTMLIPVPGSVTAEDVRVVEPGVVSRVETYAAPRLVEYTCDDLHGTGDLDKAVCGCVTDTIRDLAASAALDFLPGLLDQLDVGFGSYEVSTLAAESQDAFETWAAAEGLFVPPGAGELFADYLESGASFVSVKVDLDSVMSGGVLLKPIQFSYESDAMSLPIQLGTINAGGTQDVILHVITDSGGPVGISNYSEFTVEGDCMYDDSGWGSFSTFYDDAYSAAWEDNGGQAGWLAEYVWAPSACDPCTGGGPLSESALNDVGFVGDPDSAVITRLHMRYSPSAVSGDLMLYDMGRHGFAQHQQRYILYKPALESDFPICGEGFAENPGSCEDDTGGAPTYIGSVVPVGFLIALGGIAVGRRREPELANCPREF